jgi:hypothetical protein
LGWVLLKGQPGCIKEYSALQIGHLTILKGVLTGGGIMLKGKELKVLECNNS